MKRIVTLLFLAAGTASLLCGAEPAGSGIDTASIDTAVRPQDDLFRHVNGRWLLSTEIPADKSMHGSFSILADMARENIRTIIEEAVKNPGDATGQKVGDFYRARMDEDGIRKKGITPLKGELDAIARLASKDDLVSYFGKIGVKGISSPIGMGVTVDDKNSSRYLVGIAQSGLTLPDRDYYLADTPEYAKVREALRTYILRLHELAGLPAGAQAADAIVKLETELARINWTQTELRDSEKRYNLYTIEKLIEFAPAINWKAGLAASLVPDIKELNVMTPSYFEGLQKILADTSLDDWKHYLRLRLIDAAADQLPSEFYDASFELHQRAISGVPQPKPRWKRAVDATSLGVLNEAVGQLYVKKHFPPESRRRMLELVGNLLKAYDKSLRELTWMTDVTKQKALEKLSTITTKIGYPDEWRDYSRLEIKPDDALGNAWRTAEFEHHRQINRLNKPVDRKEWQMPPQMVNAYYNPSLNEIVFPAAILQPPFFDPAADDAVNYGGIGAVIGHEISHAFDDEGSKYDAKGNLSNWWTDADRKAYEALTQKLIDQYAGYEPLDGRKLNGKLTLGENIADLSGLSIASKAYQISLGGKPGPVIDGYTAAQRLFIGWAQVWRIKLRPDEVARRLVVDPHAPPMFRVNGAVTNHDGFHEAFQLKPGDKLYKPHSERIRIW